MRRFHRPGLPRSGDVLLDGDEGRHLARVLRAKPGDAVLLFDGAGREVRAEVAGVERDVVRLTIGEETVPPRPGRHVTLCTAMPKGQRIEWLVEKVTEAGVSRLVPVVFERSARRTASAGRLSRWRRAALEASKQCGRADVPSVEAPIPLSEALSLAAPATLFVAVPGAAAAAAEHLAGPAALFVGPEGGFSSEELALLDAAGARPVGLGPLVLRIETAAAFGVHVLANTGSQTPGPGTSDTTR